MKKTNLIRYMAFSITGIIVVSLSIKGYHLKTLTERVTVQVEKDKRDLDVHKKELEKLEEEVIQIDSPEYIEKVAREQLGMVKKDDIVFKERE